MTSWKRIASLFVLSLSTAILGAACDTRTGEPAPAEAEQEIVASPRPPFEGDGRDQCRRECEHLFDRCLHFEHGPFDERQHRCEHERFDCFERCDRRHE